MEEFCFTNHHNLERVSMDATVRWHGRLTFTGTADMGFSVPLGAESAVGGDNDGFLPMELIAVGLAGCTALDVISILQKKRQDVTDFEVRVHAERESDHPRVFNDIQIQYIVTGYNIDEKAVKRAIELSETKYCPAQGMLSKVVPITSEYLINKAQ
jgi:putative redox protein